MLLSDVQKNNSGEKISPFIVERTTFKCFRELIGDYFFFPLIIGCTLARPWRYTWLKFIINNNYEMNRSTILKYTRLNIIDMISLPFVFILGLLIMIYQIKKPYRLYTEAGSKVDKLYLEINNKSNYAGVAPINVDIDLMIIER